MCDVNVLFDAVISQFPGTEVRLKGTAPIIFPPDFEAETRKVQENRSYALTERKNILCAI